MEHPAHILDLRCIETRKIYLLSITKICHETRCNFRCNDFSPFLLSKDHFLNIGSVLLPGRSLVCICAYTWAYHKGAIGDELPGATAPFARCNDIAHWFLYFEGCRLHTCVVAFASDGDLVSASSDGIGERDIVIGPLGQGSTTTRDSNGRALGGAIVGERDRIETHTVYFCRHNLEVGL